MNSVSRNIRLLRNELKIEGCKMGSQWLVAAMKGDYRFESGSQILPIEIVEQIALVYHALHLKIQSCSSIVTARSNSLNN